MARVRSQKRIEKNERTREELFAAALSVVGEMGYARASIAKVAELAGVSTGTFYLHFTSKDELYDQLLPWAGRALFATIPIELLGKEDLLGFEERNIRGFLSYCHANPAFATVMLQAEVAAPKAWADYVQARERAYVALLEHVWDSGGLSAYARDEIPRLCAMLIGVRKVLVQRYALTSECEAAIETYMRFVAGAAGLGARIPAPTQVVPRMAGARRTPA